ncbi:MAG: response regulator transcription factor [Bacteroidia bacterium]|nr:response regulator transcription factor [Bacteroidia bacterium]
MSQNDKIKILLAEDDNNLGNLLKEYLEAKNYIVSWVKNGKEGFDIFKKNSFDLCLLDVMMPLKDGFTLAKEMRAINKFIPIVFLTAKSMKEDTIEGFTAGADDYITKPFSMEELLLRLNAILKRTKGATLANDSLKNFEIGKYIFDYENQLLTIDKKEQRLTTKEAELLRLLCLHKNDVLDRNFALNAIWKDDNYFNGRSMDVFVTRLRKYLRNDLKVEIVNVHGKGFKLLINK